MTMTGYLTRAAAIATLCSSFSTSVLAEDQCNYTAQCKNDFGPEATDCANSQSLFSVCMCGNQPCGQDTPIDPTPDNSQPVPGIIQAQDYQRYSDTTAQNLGGQYRNDGVDIQITSDNGGQYNVGWTAANEWLEYDINVQNAGSYIAKVRVASQSGGGLYTLEIDAQQRSNGTTVASTGGWQNWQTQEVALGTLTAGAHTLRIQIQAGNFNINWIELATEEDSTATPMIGRFNPAKDLLLANFDSRPDPDDIHTVAAVGTILSDSRFSGVNYHAVAGAYGIQGGTFIEADHLFNITFGSDRWSDAHTNYSGALNTTYDKVATVLNSGGDIWIQEAGQSDFSADLVRRVKQNMGGINTNTRIHIIQHSEWNQDQTTPADLTYVRNNTDYQKISDGNSRGNGTPGFNSSDTSQWSRVLNHSRVGAIWTEAKRVADYSIEHHPGWKNPQIQSGGMDFSDTVEGTWIFGFNHLNNHVDFFDEFL
ncbi:carbohydrate-binding protein [Gilvimarinus polysaccharolyticus]|uniref:carbohydrate-binding protein n=1 Tax=Gilvimarinus polysaccharolyticus TaxID=863921 RepID=UPI0006731CBD|nr:carbohydrate-binding protein [Gilvimarinus polysaccharolyticus]